MPLCRYWMPCSKCRQSPRGCAACFSNLEKQAAQPRVDEEYVVETIVEERLWADQREFKVKWQGHERATWVFAAELRENAAVTAWFSRHPTSSLPVHQGKLRQLAGLGFTREAAAKALRLELDDVEAAANKLLEAGSSSQDAAASSGSGVAAAAAVADDDGDDDDEEEEQVEAVAEVEEEDDDAEDEMPLSARLSARPPSSGSHTAESRLARHPPWPSEALDGELDGWRKEMRTCSQGKRKYAAEPHRVTQCPHSLLHECNLLTDGGVCTVCATGTQSTLVPAANSSIAAPRHCEP